jgi:hypothetical protein
MYTQNSLPTDSTTGPFPIGFNYLDAATISVTQYDLDGVSNPVAKTFSFAGTVSEDQPSGSTINLAVAIAAGKVIKIAKTIDMDTPALIWNQGAEITQKNLRKTTRNLMEMAQTAWVKAADLTTSVALALAQYLAIKPALDAAPALLASTQASATAAQASALAAADYKFTWRGAYSAAITYPINDAVSYLGTSYICKAQSLANLPTDATFWDILASKGDTGAQGIQGIQGIQGQAGTGDMTKADNLSGLPDYTASRANLGLAIGSNVQAFDSETAKLNTVQNFTKAQRGAVVALDDGATITPDFSLSNHFSVTLAGNRTLDNPTNLVAGQTGSVFISQDATGGRALAYGSFWDFIGGTAPAVSGAANKVDRLDYIVRTSGSIHAVLSRDWS